MTTTSATDRLLRDVLVLMLLACAAGLWLGGSMLLTDLGQQGEWLDGVGTLFGLVICGGVLLPATLAALAWWRSRAGRRDAPFWALGTCSTGLVVGGGFAMWDGRLALVLAVPALLGVVAVAALDGRGPR